MFNHELRKELSLNAIKNSKNYSCENIYLQWLSVLK